MTERIEAWLRARDAARFQKDMNQSAASVRRVGQAAEKDGGRGFDRMAVAGRHASSALRYVGIAAAAVTAGIGIAGAAISVFGLKFNATMEQNEVAFANFLGSTEKAKSFVQDLAKMAAETPFEMTDLTNSSRLLLAFGFTAEETKDKLMTIGDAIAGIGGGAGEIQQLTRAIGQISAKGRLQGEELLQIQELGLVKQDKLAKALGMTTDEFQKNLEAGKISAEQALPAIDKILNKQFGGAMKDQSKTFLGQLSTMKDYAAQASGALTKPLFDLLRSNVFPKINKQLEKVTKWAKEGGMSQAMNAAASGFRNKDPRSVEGYSGVAGVAGKVGAYAGKGVELMSKGFAYAKKGVQDFLAALKPAQPFFENVLLPLFKGIAIGVGITLVGAFKVVWFVFKRLMIVLGAVGKFLRPFRGVFEAVGVAIGVIFTGPILKALSWLPKLGPVLGLVGRGFSFLGKAVTVAVRPFLVIAGWIGKLLGLGVRLGGWWVKVHIRAWREVTKAASGAIGFLRSAPGRFLGAALRIGRSIVSGLRSGVQGLRGAVSGAINSVLGFISKLPGRFLNAGKRMGQAMLNGIKAAFTAVGGFAGDIGRALIDWVNRHTLFGNKINLPSPLPDITIPALPGLASGGTALTSGAVVVGERGPEILNLRAGDSVSPVRRPATVSRRDPGVTPSMAGLLGEGTKREIHVHLEYRGREIAHAVAEDTEDRKARR